VLMLEKPCLCGGKRRHRWAEAKVRPSKRNTTTVCMILSSATEVTGCLIRVGQINAGDIPCRFLVLLAAAVIDVITARPLRGGSYASKGITIYPSKYN